MFGSPGPDQGFALKLARRFEDRLVLARGSRPRTPSPAARRWPCAGARRFGRAPAVYDLAFAFTLWGFLGGAPADLVEAARAPLFRSASHHYTAQRAIADGGADEALGLSPEAVAARLDEWRELLDLPTGD